MIGRVESSTSFGSMIVRDNVFKKGYEFVEKFGTNSEKKIFNNAIDFLERDGKDSLYKVEEFSRHYPTSDYVLLKDGNIVKTVGGYVNPEFNIIGTIVRYARELGAKL